MLPLLLVTLSADPTKTPITAPTRAILTAGESRVEAIVNWPDLRVEGLDPKLDYTIELVGCDLGPVPFGPVRAGETLDCRLHERGGVTCLPHVETPQPATVAPLVLWMPDGTWGLLDARILCGDRESRHFANAHAGQFSVDLPTSSCSITPSGPPMPIGPVRGGVDLDCRISPPGGPVACTPKL